METKQNIGGERADWEYLIYVRRNSFKNWAQTRGLWLIEKKNTTLFEAKPAKSISREESFDITRDRSQAKISSYFT